MLFGIENKLLLAPSYETYDGSSCNAMRIVALPGDISNHCISFNESALR